MFFRLSSKFVVLYYLFFIYNLINYIYIYLFNFLIFIKNNLFKEVQTLQNFRLQELFFILINLC